MFLVKGERLLLNGTTVTVIELHVQHHRCGKYSVTVGLRSADIDISAMLSFPAQDAPDGPDAYVINKLGLTPTP